MMLIFTVDLTGFRFALGDWRGTPPGVSVRVLPEEINGVCVYERGGGLPWAQTE